MAGRKPIGEIAMTPGQRQARWRAKRAAAKKLARRANRRNRYRDDNGDAYVTCPEAVASLLHLERIFLPVSIFDPCAGAGGISLLLERAGHRVMTSISSTMNCQAA